MNPTEPTDELPAKVLRFIAHNKEHAIIQSAWLDKDGKEPNGGPETWVKCRSKFEDGSVLTLTEEDQKKMIAAGFMPRWKGFKQ